MNDVDLSGPAQWGRVVKGSRNTAVYEADFGGGNKVFTFVIWADETDQDRDRDVDGVR